MATQLEARLVVMEANPNTPRISLDFMRRKIFKLQGMTRAEIQVMVPYTPEEMDARNLVKLINDNDMENLAVRDLDEDHMTYLVVLQSAMDNEAKNVAIELRKKAYIDSAKKKPQEDV